LDKKNYLPLLIAGIISLVFLIYPSAVSFKIDDYVSRFFYTLNKEKFSVPEIVIVEIDNISLKEINQQWPFKRSVYAKTLDILKRENAKVAAFDIAFVGDSPSLEDDQLLESAIASFGGKTVLAYFLDKNGKPVYPKEAFRQKSPIGFINTPSDPDRVIRKTRAYYEQEGLSDFSWTIKTSSVFYKSAPKKVDDFILLKEKQIPVSKNGITDINFLFKPKDFTTISFSELFLEKFPAGLFSEKIVLIAPTLDIVHDVHATPLGYMPGTFIQANAVANVLRGKFLLPASLYLSLFVLVLMFIFTGYALLTFTFLKRFFVFVGFLLLLFWLNIALKSMGLQFFYGRVMLGGLSFLVLGNFYSYSSFLINILKIKNKMVVDPVTRLYTHRYFFERLKFESKNISVRKSYLLIIKLTEFQKLFKKENFEELKRSWADISSFLLSISNLWSRYSQDVITGRVYNPKEAQRLKTRLEAIAFEKGVEAKIKAGSIRITRNMNMRDVVPSLVHKLDESSESIVVFNENDFTSYKQKDEKREDFLSSLYVDAEDKNKELIETIEKLKGEEKKTQDAYIQLMASLVVALESKDPYTQGHTKRVCEYSLMLADKLNLPEEEKDKIRKGAILHDLGKIGIPDSVLHKKGALTDEEFEIIKKHEILSAKILEPVKEFQDIIPYVLYHHESFDGSGYPYGLAGEFIPLGARIIAVADIFDALTTGRDYKKAFSVKDSLKELENIKGKKLDPALVDKFVEAVRNSKTIKD